MAASGLQVMDAGQKMASNDQQIAPQCAVCVTIQLQYFQIGLLDIDICGPSVPHLMGVASSSIQQSPLGWIPVYPVISPVFTIDSLECAFVG